MTRIRIARAILVAVVLIVYACDSPGDDDDGSGAGSRVSLDMVVWGCERAIPSKLERLNPRWRDESVLVEDFGLDRSVTLRDAWRPDERADLQLKLPVTIEGHSGQRFGSRVINATGLR